jgi:hypothetical protein
LLTKVLVKNYTEYDQFTDRAGIRIVVQFTKDLVTAESILDEAFDVLKREDKAEELGTAEIGYQGVHFQVKLRDFDPAFAEFGGLEAEIQTRTMSQDVWSEISHKFAYKALRQMPGEWQRGLGLLNALFEMADRQFMQLHGEVMSLPSAIEYGVLQALETEFMPFMAHQPDAARHFNRELSIDAISLLLNLYPEQTNFIQHFHEFSRHNKESLNSVFEQYRADRSDSAFLFQPEVLMIFDLLKRNRYLLRERWEQKYPDLELQKLALAWGKPLE